MAQMDTISSPPRSEYEKVMLCFDDLLPPSPVLVSMLDQPRMTFMQDHTKEMKDNNAILAQCKSITEQMEAQIHPPKETKEQSNAMYSNFIYLLYQHKKLEHEFSFLQNLCNRYETEKKIMLTDHTKAEVVKNTLEGLCREFQKQNKQLMHECKQIKKKELRNSSPPPGNIEPLPPSLSPSPPTLTPIPMEEKITTASTERSKENEILKKKVCYLQEQLNNRELQITAELKAKALEVRLIEAKSSQQVKLAQQQVLKISQAYQERLTETKNNDHEIQNHLRQYTEKFEQFQDTVSKSSEIFATFKQEMERMTKTIARLEKEKSILKQKCEKGDITLIGMAEERNTQRRELEVLKTKNTRLGALCRVLRAERGKDEPEDFPAPPEAVLEQ